MHRSFGGTVFEPAEEKRDKEIVLGPFLLTVLGLALLALCSVCFLGGYAVGHSGQAQTAAVPTASGSSAAQLFREEPKPTAANDDQPAPAGQPSSSTAAESTPSQSASPDNSALVVNPASNSGAPAVVHAALPAQAAPGQPVSPAGAVQPALQPSGSWMVQIAAVSHSEDADVLMSALRQRGYAVSMRRDPVDNLIHVQVGPFSTHNDALAMRQRLLNDGYNAVIQP
jgi:DedD protein